MLVIQWIQKEYLIDYVDLITHPGMDGHLSKSQAIDPGIVEKVRLSIDFHDTEHIFIVGHENCLRNPGTEQYHRDQTLIAVDKCKQTFGFMKIIGLWVQLDGVITILNPEKI